MRFLVDAQLPPQLACRLRELGYDAKHTSELPRGNRTSDGTLAATADAEDRVVVTKDADFVASHFAIGSPKRLVVIATGNLRNRELAELLETHFERLAGALNESSYVAVTRAGLLLYPGPRSPEGEGSPSH